MYQPDNFRVTSAIICVQSIFTSFLSAVGFLRWKQAPRTDLSGLPSLPRIPLSTGAFCLESFNSATPSSLSRRSHWSHLLFQYSSLPLFQVVWAFWKDPVEKSSVPSVKSAQTSSAVSPSNSEDGMLNSTRELGFTFFESLCCFIKEKIFLLLQGQEEIKEHWITSVYISIVITSSHLFILMFNFAYYLEHFQPFCLYYFKLTQQFFCCFDSSFFCNFSGFRDCVICG